MQTDLWHYAVWAPVAAFALALVFVWRLTRLGLGQFAIDRPNERSLHNVPTPRTGGLGLHAAVLLSWPIAGAAIPNVILLLYLGLIVVSAMDDVRGLPVLVRLAAHLIAGCTVSAYLLMPSAAPATVILGALCIVWMINLYNFMDGSDGLAGGMALFGFVFYGIAAHMAGSTAFALLNFSIASAAAAFLIFNFHPARIFLGDAGSIPLGFLAGSLGLAGWLQNCWTWWFPLLVFSPFIVDASVTLLKRACARANIWRAHRDHYYQRLVQMGWGHRRTALFEYALMCICGVSALAGLGCSQSAQLALLTTVTAAYAMLIVAIEIAWRNFHRARGHDA